MEPFSFGNIGVTGTVSFPMIEITAGSIFVPVQWFGCTLCIIILIKMKFYNWGVLHVKPLA